MFFAALIATFLVSPLPHPDCQRFCLGICAYDWALHRCSDTRITYLGVWDGVPTNYEPKTYLDYQEYPKLFPPSEPLEWGQYPLEGGNRP